MRSFILALGLLFSYSLFAQSPGSPAYDVGIINAALATQDAKDMRWFVRLDPTVVKPVPNGKSPAVYATDYFGSMAALLDNAQFGQLEYTFDGEGRIQGLKRGDTQLVTLERNGNQIPRLRIIGSQYDVSYEGGHPVEMIRSGYAQCSRYSKKKKRYCRSNYRLSYDGEGRITKVLSGSMSMIGDKYDAGKLDQLLEQEIDYAYDQPQSLLVTQTYHGTDKGKQGGVRGSNTMRYTVSENEVRTESGGRGDQNALEVRRFDEKGRPISQRREQAGMASVLKWEYEGEELRRYQTYDRLALTAKAEGEPEKGSVTVYAYDDQGRVKTETKEVMRSDGSYEKNVTEHTYVIDEATTKRLGETRYKSNRYVKTYNRAGELIRESKDNKLRERLADGSWGPWKFYQM